MTYRLLNALIVGVLIATTTAALGETATPGVTSTEILIGQTVPYSGPVSGGGTIGRAHAAYFDMINEKGGINGRKVKLISLDDAFSPPKTVEHTRKLVEQDEVLLIFGSLGTPTNRATQKYLNAKHVPQLFLSSGADIFSDPKNYPYTMSGLPSYGTEAATFAKYILKKMPDAKIAIISQNDDYGRTYVNSFRATLGDLAEKMIVSQATYEVSEPTIASQIVTLRSSNADVLMNFTLGKFTPQVIQRTQEMGWKPTQFLPYVVSSPKASLQNIDPKALGALFTTGFAYSLGDRTTADNPEYKDWLAWMKKYYPSGDVNDDLNVLAYVTAELLSHVLAAAGDDLSRDNIMRIAANLQHVRVPMLLPGIEANTSSTDYTIMKDLQLLRFDGTGWTTIDP